MSLFIALDITFTSYDKRWLQLKQYILNSSNLKPNKEKYNPLPGVVTLQCPRTNLF
jgi:hypothetical protein